MASDIQLGAAAKRSNDYIRDGNSNWAYPEEGEVGDGAYLAARTWDLIKAAPLKASGMHLLALAPSGMDIHSKSDYDDGDYRRIEKIIAQASNAEVRKVYSLTQKEIAETDRRRFNTQLRSFIRGHEKQIAKDNKLAAHERLVGRGGPEAIKPLPRAVLKARFFELDSKDRKEASRDHGLVSSEEARLSRLYSGLGELRGELNRRGVEIPKDVEAGIDRFEGKTDGTVKRMLLADGDLARLNLENHGHYLLSHAVGGVELPPKDIAPLQYDAVKALIKGGSDEEVVEADRLTRMAHVAFKSTLFRSQMDYVVDNAPTAKLASLDAEDHLALTTPLRNMTESERRNATNNVGLNDRQLGRAVGLLNAETALGIEVAKRGLERSRVIEQVASSPEVSPSFNQGPLKDAQQRIQILAAAAMRDR